MKYQSFEFFQENSESLFEDFHYENNLKKSSSNSML